MRSLSRGVKIKNRARISHQNKKKSASWSSVNRCARLTVGFHRRSTKSMKSIFIAKFNSRFKRCRSVALHQNEIISKNRQTPPSPLPGKIFLHLIAWNNKATLNKNVVLTLSKMSHMIDALAHFRTFPEGYWFFVVSERPKKWHSVIAFFISVDNNIHVVTETFFHFNSLRNIHVITCIYIHTTFLSSAKIVNFILPHLQTFFDDNKKNPNNS